MPGPLANLKGVEGRRESQIDAIFFEWREYVKKKESTY